MKKYKQKGAVATAELLTVSERAIYQYQMEYSPDAFKKAAEFFRAKYPQACLPLGSADRVTTLNRVNFSNYTPDDLAQISFQGITFANATLPSADYEALLESAGARLLQCHIKGQTGTVTTAPKLAAAKPKGVGANSDAVRARQEDAAWQQFRGGRG